MERLTYDMLYKIRKAQEAHAKNETRVDPIDVALELLFPRIESSSKKDLIDRFCENMDAEQAQRAQRAYHSSAECEPVKERYSNVAASRRAYQ
jgi:hypothetical protein